MKAPKMMLLALLCSFGLAVSAQEKTTWKEQEQFHGIMSKTFHPSEEGNFKPLKEKSDSLVIVAKQWKAAKIPAGYKPKETAESIAKLLKQCETVNAAVKSNKDEKTLGSLMFEAHETFHYIVGECKTHD
ncbi:MAG: hypothetical protein RLY89_1187 [Bacteroidota bacterium]|jgi:hypothetical protein